MKPQIITSYDAGQHNADLEQTVKRLTKTHAHKDLSCIRIVPAHKPIEPRIVANWESMFSPPNQRFTRVYAAGMEVGDAYSQAIENILSHPELSTWKYIITLEHDNAPPPDGIVRLLASMEANKKYAAIGGLYFTKGYGGVAQIWGDPNEHPHNFRPQLPDPNGGIKECNGVGMGFTAFRLDMFKKLKRRPWFKTTASTEEGVGTQDLYFCAEAKKHGYKFAVDCSIRVGHYDPVTETMW
jgi:hypothetical protein